MYRSTRKSNYEKRLDISQKTSDIFSIYYDTLHAVRVSKISNNYFKPSSVSYENLMRSHEYIAKLLV